MTGRLESKVLLVTGSMMGMGRAFAVRAGSEDEVAADPAGVTGPYLATR
jgi:hypothetical protein